ncbi:hypothetical protein QG37_04442 [Candidozyma auris]|nr:hypothetical protein QG37_04442 [[Candida] auris]
MMGMGPRGERELVRLRRQEWELGSDFQQRVQIGRTGIGKKKKVNEGAKGRISKSTDRESRLRLVSGRFKGVWHK